MDPVCIRPLCARPPRTHGLCAKHYEDHLRSQMPECSIEGCTAQARSQGLCNAHYRQSLLVKKPTCDVPNCDSPAISKGLCNAHRKRLKVSGHLGFTRPEDWGTRTAHPLYESWYAMRRAKGGRSEEWRDFWKFVGDVKERPSLSHVLKRRDKTKAFGPDNWSWTLQIPSDDGYKEYQKQWRLKNARRVRSNKLKKTYGIDADDYDRMLLDQDHKCAICGGEETVSHMTSQLKRALAIDHCHVTEKVRGLLCTACNTLLGNAKDDVDILLKAVEYLRRYQTSSPETPQQSR